MAVTAFHGDQLSLWPIRPRPLPDELLSSWMIRLSHANGKKVQRFYRHWFGKASLPLWTRDLDRFAPIELLEELGQRTKVPLEQLESAALRSMVGTVFPELATGGTTSWLMTLGVFHRQRRLGGLMCCVRCLAEDESPYFRKAWRLSCMTACTRHKSMLVDRCGCGATLQPHRVDMLERRWLSEVSLATCWSCGADLRRQEPGVASPDLLAFQTWVEQAHHHGHVDVAGRQGLHSLLFFNGLRTLLGGAMRISAGPKSEGETKARFEDLAVDTRARHLAFVGRLLQDWPRTFRETFSAVPGVYSQFTRQSPARVFWVEEEVRRLNRARLVLTPGERYAIESIVEAGHGKFNQTLAVSLFGRDLSRHRAQQRPRITQEDADMVLAGVDAAISTASGVERRDLIRDRTMLLTARVLRVSQPNLSRMTVAAYANPIDDDPLDDAPSNEEDLAIYLRRFVRLDRIKHPLAAESPWLFLCSSSTGQMSYSLVGQRYNDALKLAGMDKRVPAYRDWTAHPKDGAAS